MRTLTEKEAEDFLEKESFNVVKRFFIKEKKEIGKIKEKLEFPWVMKISSKHIAHKVKLGGTIVNISSLEQAEKAFDKLKKINHFEGILVQEMIFGEEFILGIKNTSEFGEVIMFGKGGTNVEKDKDVSFRIPKIDEKQADTMIKETKIFQKVKDKISLKELIANIIKLSKLAEQNPNISELDINPIIINKNEATIVDARIVLN